MGEQFFIFMLQVYVILIVQIFSYLILFVFKLIINKDGGSGVLTASNSISIVNT
jgi:hypothetical protein